jgi:LA2681-like HEPN
MRRLPSARIWSADALVVRIRCESLSRNSGKTHATMNEQDRLQKTALCNTLMNEGIDGRQGADAVLLTCTLTDLAVELERKDGLACAISWYEILEQKGLRGEQAILLDYGRSNAIAGNRYGTQWSWEQPTLAQELFYLRRAVSHQDFAQVPDVIRCICLNNLGNRLCVAGRTIEALDYWRRALEVQPTFGMSLCNRARAFVAIADGLEDGGARALFLWAAYREASAAIAPTASYTDARDERNKAAARSVKDWIAANMDVKGIAAVDPFEQQDVSATQEEREYQHWCLKNCLYLNLLNDLGRYPIGSDDPISLAGHVVPVDSPHKFESFFDQMKQEFVSARWLLYEGVILKKRHFSDNDVFLLATEPRPALSLAVEKVKMAYRTAYSLFDKVGFFMNAYMELGIRERDVSFRTLWKSSDKKSIRKEFDLNDNWAFCALYWLAKDFYEKATDDVAEPQARGLSELRNHLEHKYLRVTVAAVPAIPPDDLALTMSRERLEAKALHLLRLSRAALLYLVIGVRFEDRRRQRNRAGIPLEDIPLPAYLPDGEKV